MPDLKTVLGKNLSKILNEKGLSQTDLAKKLDVSFKTVNSYIKGRTGISGEMISKLAQVLDVEETDLVMPEIPPQKVIIHKAEFEAFQGLLANLQTIPVSEKSIVPPKLLLRLSALNESQRKELFDMIDHQIDAVLTLDDEDQESGSETG